MTERFLLYNTRDDYLQVRGNVWCNGRWSLNYVLRGVNKEVASAISGFNSCVRYVGTRRGPSGSFRRDVDAPFLDQADRKTSARPPSSQVKKAKKFIEEARKRGDKACQRAGQAFLWATLTGMDPIKAQETAAKISNIDPTTNVDGTPPVFHL